MGKKESSVKTRTEPGTLTFGRHLESGGWEVKGQRARRAEVRTFRGRGIFGAIIGMMEGSKRNGG